MNAKEDKKLFTIPNYNSVDNIFTVRNLSFNPYFSLLFEIFYYNT